MDAQLRQQRIDGPNLNALAPATVAEAGGFDMIAPGGRDQRKWREALHDSGPRLGLTVSLQQLLQDDPRCVQRLAVRKGVPQTPNFRIFPYTVSA